MNTKKNVSSLGNHILHKKRGVLATPLNDALGDKLAPNSWARQRMPEYLWLGLILRHYGRNVGFQKCTAILSKIAQMNDEPSYPRFSLLLGLPAHEQRAVYDIILDSVDKAVLAPLTVLYRAKDHPIFNEYFFISHLLVEDRISELTNAIALYYPHQADEATDLRYLVLSLLLFRRKLVFPRGMDAPVRALQEYPYTDHEDEKMRYYRPTVRAMEAGMAMEKYDDEFSSRFWRCIGMLTPCKPMKVEFARNEQDYGEFAEDCRKVLAYVHAANKDKALADDKFTVVVSSINYALKIFAEINGKALGNSILGRHAIRTIIEVYIILRYLHKREGEIPAIWRDYQRYGISKYKLVLLKAREYGFADKSSHFLPGVIDILVNQYMAEEFIDVDLKYFDKQGIREKSEEAGEKKLYDIFYDYDSSYAHGLWGAIRESAMLYCDNADHQYHSVPDLYANQALPDVTSDAYNVMKLLFGFLSELYETPSWFQEKYLAQK